MIGGRDFEDAVQFFAAVQLKSECLITRNKGDYKAGILPVLTPEEFPGITLGYCDSAEHL